MPTEIRSTIPQLYVKVNGRDLPPEAFNAILEGVVEGSVHLPDACSLRIHDNDFKWLDSDHWKEGNLVTIQAGQGREQLFTVFEGEVTTLEMDLAAIGVAMLTVRCMDRAHRLHRGRKRQTFSDSTDSDIVKKIANQNNLLCNCDATSTVHPWTLQNNQSDWEFLQVLAKRSGCRVYLEGEKKLSFIKVSDQADKETEMEWGKDLRSFRIRVNSSNQVSKVIVKGWDPANKRTIVGQATAPKGVAKISMRGDGGATGKQVFGNAEMVVVDHPVRSVQDAVTLAQSICDEIGNSYIEADGLCYNHPELRPNHKIKLTNIGQRFNGTYIVTSTTHTFSAAEGFSTQFVISGKQPATLLSILGGSK